VASSIIANIAPEVGAINAPYLFRDVARARAVLDGPIGAELRELSRAKGLPVLAWGENGLRQVTSNKPVRNLADMHGLKIRVPQSDIILGGFRALGADPKKLAFPLLRDALRTGEFDAQENPVAVIETSKFNDVQKYLCLTSHIYDGLGITASPDLLEDLTEPQRAALVVCAQKAASLTRQASETGAKEGIARLKSAGMVVIDDVDVAGLKAACQPFLEGLAQTYGETRMKSLLAVGA
jgi:tripartite ATP-independent transporter DctP family solute receptor